MLFIYTHTADNETVPLCDFHGNLCLQSAIGIKHIKSTWCNKHAYLLDSNRTRLLLLLFAVKLQKMKDDATLSAYLNTDVDCRCLPTCDRVDYEASVSAAAFPTGVTYGTEPDDVAHVFTQSSPDVLR
jgi:hypothetical protein